MSSIGQILVVIALTPIVLILILVQAVGAYVDPGTTGVLSQILYVLFYGALGISLYFLRSIRQHLTRVKESLKRLLS